MATRVMRTAAAAAAVALLGLPASGAAAAVKTARFTMKITGVQTTAWSWTGPSYTDCNGTQTTKGDGTEVFRFDNGAPDHVLVTRNAFGAVDIQIGSWKRSDPAAVLGSLSRS